MCLEEVPPALVFRSKVEDVPSSGGPALDYDVLIIQG